VHELRLQPLRVKRKDQAGLKGRPPEDGSFVSPDGRFPVFFYFYIWSGGTRVRV